MFEEQHQEALAELKGAGKLTQDLPHAVQEEQKDWGLLPRFDVGVGRLGAALLEWVARLWLMGTGKKTVIRRLHETRTRGLSSIKVENPICFL